MTDTLTIMGMWPTSLVIKKKTDVKKFIDGLAKTFVNIPDVNDNRYYYSIQKDEDGRVLFGRTLYGKDALTGPPILLDDRDLENRIFAARKSINERFFRHHRR